MSMEETLRTQKVNRRIILKYILAYGLVSNGRGPVKSSYQHDSFRSIKERIFFEVGYLTTL